MLKIETIKKKIWLIVILATAILAASISYFFFIQEKVTVFSIEDNNLISLTPKAISAIQNYGPSAPYSECTNFKGKQVDLASNGKRNDWLAITSDGCGWGANSAAIWVLKSQKSGYQVILMDAGSGVAISDKNSYGLRRITFTYGTKGYYSERSYKFNGKAYVKSRERNVDLTNPEECRKNKDICQN
jgi:hypothetical protein